MIKDAPKQCHACLDGEYVDMKHTIKNFITPQAWMVNEYTDYCEAGDLDQFEDVYMCNNPACVHIYRNFFGNSAEFHAGEYREHEYKKDGKNVLNLGSAEEQKKRWKRVQNQINIFDSFLEKNHHILEIATGKGYLARVLSQMYKNFVGSDIDPKVVEHNQVVNPDLKVILSDVIKLPEDKKYDVVIAMDVLEHVEDTVRFAKKMHSLTKKYAIIQVPINRRLVCPNKPHLQGLKNFDGHLHYFSKFSLNNLFTQNDMFRCVLLYQTSMGEVANGPELLAVFEKV
tara:strand:+ start:1311 stop:2165 length:855 start_codon:yes stop_codon:yes gene_type:complete